MPKVNKHARPPENSLILNNFNIIDYCDSYQIVKTTDDSIEKITTDIFKIPEWVAFLLWIREIFGKLFGLERVATKNTHETNNYPIGSKTKFFTVIDRNDHEIVMVLNPVKSHTLTGACRTVWEKKKLVQVIVHQVCDMERFPRNFL